MRTKKHHIQAIKQGVGWIYSQLNWLTDEEAVQAMEDRDELLRPLLSKVNTSYQQNKLHQGALSPGCATCGDGTWSCLFMNGLCTAHCFFCPQDRGMKEERPPKTTGEIVFHNPKDYADYVQKAGFRGVGFSGGESLLVYEKLLSFIGELRKRLGKEIYLWAYTNGDLVDRDKLEGLKQAGLDEIRFNIAARSYALRSVELALNFIETVSVEIPAIPEDFEVVKDALSAMDSLGVRHLNLHQLLANPYNYSDLTHRNYTLLHHPINEAHISGADWVPILESEMTALRLLLYAAENGIALPINYCSQAYKRRLQGRGHRMRAAPLIRKSFEDITDSGYIRRLTIQGTQARLEHLAGLLAATGCPDSRWSLSEDRSGLAIHPSLLQHIEGKDYSFTLSYFASNLRDTNSQMSPKQTDSSNDLTTTSYYRIDLRDDANSEETDQELVLNPERTVFAAKGLVAEYRGLSLATIRSFKKLFIDKMSQRDVLRWFSDNYDIETKEKIRNMAREKDILMDLTTWEEIPAGFPEIY